MSNCGAGGQPGAHGHGETLTGGGRGGGVVPDYYMGTTWEVAVSN